MKRTLLAALGCALLPTLTACGEPLPDCETLWTDGAAAMALPLEKAFGSITVEPSESCDDDGPVAGVTIRIPGEHSSGELQSRLSDKWVEGESSFFFFDDPVYSYGLDLGEVLFNGTDSVVSGEVEPFRSF